MNLRDSSDLLQRVQRYEVAAEELRSAQAGVRHVLIDEILFDRWQQLGADLGFTAQPLNAQQAQRDLEALNEQMPAMTDSWAG
jgi:hypothetical protein